MVFFTGGVMPHLPLPQAASVSQSDNPLSVLHCDCSGLTCKVSARNDVACLTTDLLAALGKLEPVLIPLVLAFRYWARVSYWIILNSSF